MDNYDVAGLPSSILRELTTRCTKKGFDFQEPGNPLVQNEIERLRVSYERKKLRSKTASAARRKKVKALLAGLDATPAPAAAAHSARTGVSPVADTVVAALCAVPAEPPAMPAFAPAGDTTPIEEVVAAADTTVSTSADRLDTEYRQQADVQPTTTWQPRPRRDTEYRQQAGVQPTTTWQTRPTRQRQAHAPRARQATGLIRRRV
jgi:hypothetical protein